MHTEELRRLLHKVKSGKISIDQAWVELKRLPFANLGFAKLDTHRHLRKGFPEVIFCQGKTKEQIEKIVKHFLKDKSLFFATRVSPEIYQVIKKISSLAQYFREARIVTVGKIPVAKKSRKYILVITAGTADIPVAEEAATTAQIMGNQVKKNYDIGVAGIHRLLENWNKIQKAKVIIVVAGMEGALASVIAGLVSQPVIAVPTSVGYGANFQGLAPLLTMLNCCAPGVVVVNIDNGFGAGYFASLINQL
ncbi:MAG: nickel pincer cofactor biosynthesis protein LarB [Candidatus Edwardsbacteria bacterium]